MGSRRRRSPHEFTGRVYSAPTRMTGYRVHAFLARIRRTRLVNDARRDDPAPCEAPRSAKSSSRWPPDVHTRRMSTRSSGVTRSTSVSGVAGRTTAPRLRAKSSHRRNERALARASREPDPLAWRSSPAYRRRGERRKRRRWRQREYHTPLPPSRPQESLRTETSGRPHQPHS